MDRQTTIERLEEMEKWLLDKSYSDLRARDHYEIVGAAIDLLNAQKPVKPHRNYQYLSDYWCQCGWHLGKTGSVKFCPNCGRMVKWDG